MAGPAYYQGLRDRGVAEVDGVFSETLVVQPMRGAAHDPDRLQVAVQGVFRTGKEEANPILGAASGVRARVNVAGAGAVLALAVSRYGALDVRKGDLLRAIQREGRPWFEVLHVDRSGHSRIMIYAGEGG